ncbi:hypothetical protein CDEST_01961 [Colletotrichum destructivum]|uniref:Uncharacterized protein n=1 Tax=Colletotrichum destructivum TaxID=34406 RepID=A0AAX4I0L8_9PEZI|nr:hypothetical protein CDEST_01961 [Colletotrichum destructivum]
MESPLNQSSPTLDDSAARFFNTSFIDENELHKLVEAVQIKQERPRKRARVNSSNSNPATPDDGFTAPDTPDIHTRRIDLWPEVDVVIRVTAGVDAVSGLAQEVVQEVAKNQWPVTISMKFDGSDEAVFIARISPQHGYAIQEITRLLERFCRNTERA